MKKFLFAIIALLPFLFTDAKAQMDITDNYSRLYAGYANMGSFDAPSGSENDNGFLVGYTYGANVTNGIMPLFIEFGAEYSMVMGGDDPLDEKVHMINVPLSLTYKIGNDDINFAPLAGADFRYNAAFTIDGESYSELMTKCQGCWHVGANINFRNLSLGYKFTNTFNELIKHSDITAYTHSVILGICF